MEQTFEREEGGDDPPKPINIINKRRVPEHTESMSADLARKKSDDERIRERAEQPNWECQE